MSTGLIWDTFIVTEPLDKVRPKPFSCSFYSVHTILLQFIFLKKSISERLNMYGDIHSVVSALQLRKKNKKQFHG